jgi:hypothetical protein
LLWLKYGKYNNSFDNLKSNELFLLARFTIESSYGISSQSVVNVLEGQRDDDQRLLRFLYKPNCNTLHIFLKYDPNEWPIVAEFIQRRRLGT